MNHKEYMDVAFEEAFIGMRNNQGGPFGAVIVLHDNIIGRAHNMVTQSNDPTAHAEVMAIRNACKNLNSFKLDQAVLYTSCEPCPMCLAAIYWAGIKTLYYCADKADAHRIGFDDNFIYDEFKLPIEQRSIACKHLDSPLREPLFHEWENKTDKTPY